MRRVEGQGLGFCFFAKLKTRNESSAGATDGGGFGLFAEVVVIFHLAKFQVEWIEPDFVMAGAAFREGSAFADKNIVRQAMGVMMHREETAFFGNITGLKLDPIQLQGIRPD